MSAHHTPGPWSILMHSDGDTLLNVIAGEPVYIGGADIQATWIAELDAESLEGEPGENEANARLIAAAPEMIAALKGLLSPDRHGVYGTQNLIAAAWDAIDKAETGFKNIAKTALKTAQRGEN